MNLSRPELLSAGSFFVWVCAIFKDYSLHVGGQGGNRLTFLTEHVIWKHSVGEKSSTELSPNPVSSAELQHDPTSEALAAFFAKFVKGA